MRLLLPLAVAAGLAGCATDSERAQQRWVEAGPTVNCITIHRIRSTHVVDDRTIQFMINNNQMMQNTLPFACPGLAMQRTFQHNSRTTQLCSVNTITVLNSTGPRRGASCGLGPFQPMTRAEPREVG